MEITQEIYIDIFPWSMTDEEFTKEYVQNKVGEVCILLLTIKK